MAEREIKIVNHMIYTGVAEGEPGEARVLVVPPPRQPVRHQIGTDVKDGRLSSAGVINLQFGGKTVVGFESRYRTISPEGLGKIALETAGVVEKDQTATTSICGGIRLLPSGGEWSIDEL